MIKKIVSGGKVGADQAALDAAIQYGIPHGGWIQKGRKTQSGILPSKYQLKEMPTASFKKRIEQNVIDPDGTVIISHGILTGGSDYSRKIAEKHNRPCLHIDLNKTPAFIAASKINTWVKENNIEVLNVTGSRTSEDSKIYKVTMYIVEGAILLGFVKAKPSEHLLDYDKEDYLEKLPILPKTVDEAVDQIIKEMPLQDKVRIANMKMEDLEPINLTLGIYIRDQLIQKDVNRELFESCCTVSGNDNLNESNAAFLIIEKLWEKLSETHKLRVVK